MKLSDRTSLAGRPEFLRPASQVEKPIALVPRKCAMCGVLDVVQTWNDEPMHSVSIELRYIAAANEEVAKQKITHYLTSRGWRFRFHLGRFAMERDICRACLVAHKELEAEFKRKRTNELKSSLKSDSYYLALCGD